MLNAVCTQTWCVCFGTVRLLMHEHNHVYAAHLDMYVQEVTVLGAVGSGPEQCECSRTVGYGATGPSVIAPQISNKGTPISQMIFPFTVRDVIYAIVLLIKAIIKVDDQEQLCVDLQRLMLELYPNSMGQMGQKQTKLSYC